MAKFRSVPLPRSEEEFVKSAEPAVALKSEAGQGDPVAIAPATEESPPRRKKLKTKESRPWQGLDPNERADVSQTVRLNAYQHEQLKWIAEKEDRSLSQVLRRLLGPALDSATR